MCDLPAAREQRRQDAESAAASGGADDDGASSSGGSDFADFLDDVAGSSDDGELPAQEPEPAATPVAAKPSLHAASAAAAAAAAPPSAAAAAAAASAEPAAPLRAGDDSSDPRTALLRAFQRSEAPREVASTFERTSDWQSVATQVALWEDVLQPRMADGAGSREYVVSVLKAVVNLCDRERIEVAERLLTELLDLQTGAAARKAAAEAATLDAVEAEATAAAAAVQPAGTDPAAQAAAPGTSPTDLATARPRYAQEEGPEALAVSCLPCPEDAQLLRCVRKPNAVSKDEIEGLLSMLPMMRSAGAGVQKRQGLAAAGAGGRASRSEASATADDDPSAWVTTYCHTHHLFQQRFPDLFTRLRQIALDTDDENWGIRKACEGGDCGAVRARVIEVHEAGPGAGLNADKHYDSGSIVTLDVLLSDASEFEGGHLQMMEPDGSKTRPTFEQGDAIVFPSHKYHTVVPVSKGRRRTMILEFWCGEERTCPHRCEQHWGHCQFDILQLPSTAATSQEQQQKRGEGVLSGGFGQSKSVESWARFRERVRSGKPLSLCEQPPRLRIAPLPPSMPQPDALADGLDALLLPYMLHRSQIGAFRRDGFVRLRGVVPDTVVAAARAELISIVLPAMAGGVNVSDPDNATKASLRRYNTGAAGEGNHIATGADAEGLWDSVSKGQPWHVQHGWKLRACCHQMVLAPRLGQIITQLLGLDEEGSGGGGFGGVRLYQEDCVSRPPGSGRTVWRQCGDRLSAHDTTRWKTATVWIPLQPTTPEMGAVTYAATTGAPAQRIDLSGCPSQEEADGGEARDAFVSQALEQQAGVTAPDGSTYNLGDISVHLDGGTGAGEGSAPWYCHPPNNTTATRMSLECTYFADGATMRDDDDATSSAFENGEFDSIAPGVKPGQVISTDRNPLLKRPSAEAVAAATEKALNTIAVVR